jgi:SAM-dependent methyltransferase
MDYASYAATYATARWAVPWVLAPLERAIQALPAGSIVLDLGCGTGNYLSAVSARAPALRAVGLDLSRDMLAQARRVGAASALAVADADVALPLRDGVVGVAFAVDVVHHLTRYELVFAELARVLAPGGRFIAVTDLEENLGKRSLTRLFPEVLEVELARYPALETLDGAAARAGLSRVGRELAEGWYELDDRFVAALGERCSSSMRLIAEEAHRRGMIRVAEARARGERWLSSYTVLTYEKPRSTDPRNSDPG